MFEESMRKKLKKKPEILDKILPSFAPGCRRLTPGPGFLEALTEENVDFISKPIKRITPKGVELEDGIVVEVDILVCATGFNAAGAPPFPVVSPIVLWTRSTATDRVSDWNRRKYIAETLRSISRSILVPGGRWVPELVPDPWSKLSSRKWKLDKDH